MKLQWMVALAVLTGCCPVKYVTVRRVGGCGASGYCSVLLDDGTRTELYKPIEGASERIERCN